jgi:hypothetical protein
VNYSCVWPLLTLCLARTAELFENPLRVFVIDLLQN